MTHERDEARRLRPRTFAVCRPSGGFGRLLGWTALGALLPGSNFVAAGYRRTGAVILGLLFLAFLPVAVFGATGELQPLVLKAVVRPSVLLSIAGAAVVAGLIWAAVVVFGHLALRGSLSRAQHVTSVLVVLALVAAVLVPTATVARYAMAQRSLLLNVFAKDGDTSQPRDPNLASPDTTAEDPWAATPRINVLLIGSDAGTGRRGTRADTLITASINTQTGDTVLFSLPRNLEYAPFPPGTPGAKAFPNGFYCPGSRECLLNGIWTWAENNRNLFPGDPEPGLTATRQAVGETLGLSIDYYAKVDLQGFKDVVDAMGGLEVDVARRVPVPGRFLEPGRQILLGDEVLAYSRSRSDSDDYERMERQRCIVGEIIDQADPQRMALAFPKLASSAQRNVATDVRLTELDAFVDLALRMKQGTVKSLAFTDEVIRSADPDFDLIRASVQASLGPTSSGSASESAGVSPGPNVDAWSTQKWTGLTPYGVTALVSSVVPPKPDPELAQNLQTVCG